MKPTVEMRLDKAHLAIMKNPSFCAWAGLLFIGKKQVVEADHEIKTAAVNAAGDVFYNRTFVEGMPSVSGVDVHMNFVVLHETGHKAMMHLTRGKELWKQSPQLANIAADHVVNNLIFESDPEEKFAKTVYEADGSNRFCRDPKYIHWSFKEVFNDLKKQMQQQGGGGGGKGQAMDTHDLSGGEDGQELTKEKTEAIEKAVENALRSGSYLASKMGGSANRLVGDLLEPKLDWRELMAEFIQEACQGDDNATWRRPMKRFIGEDMYFPSTITETIGEVAACIDVSGSVGGAEMNACISEVVELCRITRPTALRLIYWSCGVVREEVYTPDQYDQIHNLTHPVGGGGTEIVPVADYVRELENIQCAVILTDGYTSDGWGNWGDIATLWVMTTKNMIANCGKSLYLEV